jgi:hypothetical protein
MATAENYSMILPKCSDSPPVATGEAQSLDAGAVKAGREAVPAVVNPVRRSNLRATLDLNGEWEFATDAKVVGESEGWYSAGVPLPFPRKILVPGCWEAQGVGDPGLSHAQDERLSYEAANVQLRSAYTGAAWYKKNLPVPSAWAGKQIWLKLGGVNCQGWVWVNGVYIAHSWAYCGTWKYDITDLVAPGGEVTVAVLVRNDMPSRRGESNSVRAYGGLYRGVELEATSSVSIDNAFAEPLFDQAKVRFHIALRIATEVVPADPYTLKIRVTTRADHRLAGEVTLAAPLVSGTLSESTAEVDLNPFLPWSPESPSLYDVEIVLLHDDHLVDGWVERFGVKKYEVRGGDYYLNNTRFFVRACSENHVYPESICSPASREAHAQHLQIVKNYGFNYVRMHTHCENPEYFEAADEVGIMIQPELPYYGARSGTALNHMSCAPETPEADLRELVAHYRRYTSLAIYCGGNELSMPSPLGEALFQLAKSLDPSRPWLCLDGGLNNTPENSEADHYGYGANLELLEDKRQPQVRHEYSSLGIYEDPRIEPKFTTGFAPTQSLEKVKAFLSGPIGLDWSWADQCFDAGGALQSIWNKLVIESARIDPLLDGFSFWLMVDISPIGQCGILDTFWGRKQSTPETFRQFNSSTVICARTVGSEFPEVLGLNPSTLIHTEGDILEVDWVVSHFQEQPLVNATLAWELAAGNQILASGSIDGVNVVAGAVPVVGRSRIVIPTVPHALNVTLKASLESAGSSNSWDLWIYPKFQPQPGAGKGIAASSRAYELLASRYPGLAKLGTPQAADATLLVACNLLEPGVSEALEQGQRVVCLSLPGYNLLNPGTELGEWASAGVSNQAGTAIADHSAFGSFPHGPFLDQGWFRLVDTAEKLDEGHAFRHVEPLVVGVGRHSGYAFGILGYPLGFNLYAFQAKVGQGKLLASGFHLTSENPESVYLLDQFVRYAHSPDFQPKGSFDLEALRQQPRSVPALDLKRNRLVIARDQAGNVSLRFSQPGFSIRYTLDGSEPTATSNVYVHPFSLRDGGTVKACAYLEGGESQTETVTSRFGCDRSSWSVVKVSYQAPGNEKGCAGPEKLLNDDPGTYWHTCGKNSPRNAPPHEVILDMGRSRMIKAFTLLPRQRVLPDGTADRAGTPDEYEFYLSTNGDDWRLAAKGTLSAPLDMQIITLEKPESGRFLRFLATHVVDNVGFVAVAGIGAIEVETTCSELIAQESPQWLSGGTIPRPAKM